jgi:ATP-dependent helicase HrpB
MATSLPIDDVIPSILDALAARRAVVVQAPPGAGKTTRVPPALLDRVAGSIVVLEPRRIAARMSARRVAEERGERVGETIGFEVRFDRAISDKTRVSYVTEGILTRRLVDDPELRGVGAVVLDEFHERHLQGDVALALLASKKSGPKLIVMSATLDAAPVAKFLDDAPIVTSEGKRFDVALEHLDRPDDRPLHLQVAGAVRRIAREEKDGDVLVFLPGAAEIRRAMEACEAVARDHDLLVLPLHGDLPFAQQDRAVAPADRRKVILSTNVAETSITVEGIVAVVDSGLARVASHDPWTGRPTLEVAKISRASAAQRAGRAGRTRPGRALRLYTKGDHDSRPEHDTPEIARADLAETALQLRAFGVRDARSFHWLDAPPRVAVEAAEILLGKLRAIDDCGATTEIGRRMARFALSPRLARVLVEAEKRGVEDEATGVVALLSESDRRRTSIAHIDDDAHSDLDAMLDDLRDPTIGRVRKQLRRAVRSETGLPKDVDAEVRKCVLAGFPDRVARRRPSKDGRAGGSRDLLLAGGGSAQLDESSAVKTAPWLVALDARDHAGRARVRLASAIEPEWLLELFPESIEESIDVAWNGAAERVDATERMLYEGLVLDERAAGSSADERAAQMLADRALAAGFRAFANEDEVDSFDRLRARIAFVVRAAPDLAERHALRPLDDDRLRAAMIARCAGKRSFADLRGSSLLDELRLDIGHAALTQLDRLAPDVYIFPNARRSKIEYPPNESPSLSSRLQDFFGRAEGPRLLDGRVPVVLHLLAPNGRDVQVTTDLAGFWANHYPTLRTSLMRRYPKHAWPDDPRHAAPPERRR